LSVSPARTGRALATADVTMNVFVSNRTTRTAGGVVMCVRKTKNALTVLAFLGILGVSPMTAGRWPIVLMVMIDFVRTLGCAGPIATVISIVPVTQAA
jgi:hypothetical protein